MKKILILLAALIVALIAGQASRLLPNFQNAIKPQTQTVVYEESVITKVVEDSLPSVVTVGISKMTQTGGYIQINPFNPFGPFQEVPGQSKKIEQNIGSGFIISQDGLIITNRHVVSDTSAGYQVLTNDKKKYDVKKIYRDPLNDLAILKIDASGLKPLKLGDSSHLKLGQIAIAIGTPLGEFTNTITKGIISGLGRGITAGSPLEGYVEKLDNVIQTDAAINPGNSGGPLLNSQGEVIGINTAVSSEGQNIGFAIPVNVIKTLIEKFNSQGASFDRPYLGVRYTVSTDGAHVVDVIAGSPAESSGIKTGDIITELDGQKIKSDDDQQLAKIISEKKIGDTIQVKLLRDKETVTLNVTLQASP